MANAGRFRSLDLRADDHQPTSPQYSVLRLMVLVAAAAMVFGLLHWRHGEDRYFDQFENEGIVLAVSQSGRESSFGDLARQSWRSFRGKRRVDVVGVRFPPQMKVTQEVLADLQCFPRLRQIDLEDTDVTDEALYGLHDVISPEWWGLLNLGNTDIRGHGLSCLAGKQLRILDLRGCQLETSSLAMLGSLDAKIIDIEATPAASTGVLTCTSSLGHTRFKE